MTKQEIKHSRRTDTNITGALAGMSVYNGKLLDCYARAGQTFFMNAFKLNQEILRFTGERFQADLRALQALCRCGNWNEVADCQTAFARTAAESYETEMSKLATMSTDATSATLKPLQEAAETLSDGQAAA